ncbi:Aste57867_22806 [Aphanomyces stellatus]|uniref:RNA polymerase II-associated protein 3 n=1 Tax=Aphanomyces stellatus TaxID=120398 RepID=A0A485LQS8_9STRA|nr:hypothetical protein As57867_022736 [Aphanomyces stellatus]VFT99457.1 Aste57867_22806 [Aphanomyces stellatus]
MESLTIQHQIRENASYLQDYFSDLSAWEKSMAKKEQQLQSSKRPTAPVRKAVAMNVRGSQGTISTHHPINATMHTPETSTKLTKAPAQHVYDKGYKKWDTFDVDAALQEVDARPSPQPAPEAEDDDTPVQPRRKAVVVTKPAATRAPPPPPSMPRELLEKEDGNMHFKKGEYASAVACYSRSLSYQPRNAVVLSNRAMAHLKLQQFAKAESDCDLALRIDAAHVKSLVRRATARNALGKHHAALADLEAALEVEPSNKTIATQLAQTRDQLKHAIKRSPTVGIEVHTVAPISVAVEKSPTAATPKPAPAAIQAPHLPEKAPATAYEFLRVWKGLKARVDLRRQYLRRLRNLPKLFRDSVEADLLSELLEALWSAPLDAEFAIEFLHSLIQVPRFSVVAMFLSDDEKRRVTTLVDQAAGSHQAIAAAVRAAFT